MFPTNITTIEYLGTCDTQLKSDPSFIEDVDRREIDCMVHNVLQIEYSYTRFYYGTFYAIIQ